MLKLLKQPYPVVDSSKRMVRMVTIIVFCFVFLFISVFKPFSIEDAAVIGVIPAAFLFAGFSSLFYLCYVKATTWLMSKSISDEKWNVGRELLYINGFLLALSIGNSVLRSYIAPTPQRTLWENVWDDLFYTYSIALFPIAAIITIRYIKELKKHKSEGEENVVLNEGPENNFVFIRSRAGNNDIQLEPQQILFFKSEGNYVEFHIQDGDKVERLLRRNTIAYIEEQITDRQEFLRTHRQYIVNTRKITEVKGNAQGYKLKLKGVEEVIPVSRNNIPSFKEVYNSNNNLVIRH